MASIVSQVFAKLASSLLSCNPYGDDYKSSLPLDWTQSKIESVTTTPSPKIYSARNSQKIFYNHRHNTYYEQTLSGGGHKLDSCTS